MEFDLNGNGDIGEKMVDQGHVELWEREELSPTVLLQGWKT